MERSQNEPILAVPPLADMTTPPLCAPPPPPPTAMGEKDFALVREATVRRKAITRAARTAGRSAISTLIIGALAAVTVVFWPSWIEAEMTLAVCIVGAFEYAGWKKMRRADPSAASWLGRNQLAFLGIITLYCVIRMLTLSGEDIRSLICSPEVRSQLSALPEMQKSVEQLDHWLPLLIKGFLGLVIILSIVCQGGLALYYFTRKRHLDAYNAQTPEWVRRMFIETNA